MISESEKGEQNFDTYSKPSFFAFLFDCNTLFRSLFLHIVVIPHQHSNGHLRNRIWVTVVYRLINSLEFWCVWINHAVVNNKHQNDKPYKCSWFRAKHFDQRRSKNCSIESWFFPYEERYVHFVNIKIGCAKKTLIWCAIATLFCYVFLNLMAKT